MAAEGRRGMVVVVRGDGVSVSVRWRGLLHWSGKAQSVFSFLPD